MTSLTDRHELYKHDLLRFTTSVAAGSINVLEMRRRCYQDER